MRCLLKLTFNSNRTITYCSIFSIHFSSVLFVNFLPLISSIFFGKFHMVIGNMLSLHCVAQRWFLVSFFLVYLLMLLCWFINVQVIRRFNRNFSYFLYTIWNRRKVDNLLTILFSDLWNPLANLQPYTKLLIISNKIQISKINLPHANFKLVMLLALTFFLIKYFHFIVIIFF